MSMGDRNEFAAPVTGVTHFCQPPCQCQKLNLGLLGSVVSALEQLVCLSRPLNYFLQWFHTNKEKTNEFIFFGCWYIASAQLLS